MKQTDTSLGGPARRFPTTVWSEILSAADPSHPDCRASLDRLFRTYWKPVYAYIRAAWRKPVEDAKDLSQAFFTRLLEKDTLTRLRPERGSFRGYLKRALSHFLIDADRHETVRRPKGPVFQLQATPGDLDALAPCATEESPDRAYDREWARCLVHDALADLQRELEAEGRASHWKVFQAYCLEPEGLNAGGGLGATILADGSPDAPTYKGVAEKVGVSETDVRHYLSHCRGALRRLLRARVRDYTACEEDVDTELAQVLSG